MTGEMMSLKGLVEKTPDADGLREMISFAASRLMEQEVSALTGARYGEKDPERRAKAATVTATVPGRHALAPLVTRAGSSCFICALSFRQHVSQLVRVEGAGLASRRHLAKRLSKVKPVDAVSFLR